MFVAEFLDGNFILPVHAGKFKDCDLLAFTKERTEVSGFPQVKTHITGSWFS